MSQITLRNLDPDMEREIRRIAKEEGKSLNRVLIDMISQITGLKEGKEKRPSEALKKLAGGWSEEDASTFFDSIKSCEQIDEELWK